jgi:hypothetical protein
LYHYCNSVILKLKQFNQTKYIVGGASLMNTGFVYIPTACQENNGSNCTLHISFHGCNQNVYAIGDAYVSHIGLNAWAESNKLIVLYPQAATSIKSPSACFVCIGSRFFLLFFKNNRIGGDMIRQIITASWVFK